MGVALGCRASNEGRQFAVPGRAELEGKAQAVGSGAGPGGEGRVVGLGEIHEPAVMAEHHVPQVRMPVEAQALHDQAVEVAGQVVGQEEGADLVLDQGVESLLARKEGVAMGRSEEHTSELQSLMRISYAVLCL